MSVTITDVAKRLNMSHSTVSRVLNGRSGRFFSEETRKTVLRTAEEMGYRPNRLARSLTNGRSQMIGVVAPELIHSFNSRIVTGIQNVCDPQGHQILLGREHGDPELEKRQIQLLLDYRIDGLLCLVGGWQTDRMSHWLGEVLERQIPCALIDCRAWADQVDCVVSDDVAGARSAVEHLIGLGHRRIAHLSGPQGSPIATPAQDRLRGYQSALEKAGIQNDPLLVGGGSYEPEDARSAVRTMLTLPDPPTAFFAANDGLAWAVIQALADAGRRVPEDASVVGYGYLELTQGLELTTVDQQPLLMGQRAAELVFQRLDAPNAPPTLVTIATQFRPGRTSSFPPKKSA